MNTIEYLRQFRLFEYAIFDLVVSFLGIFLLSPLLSKLFLLIRIKIPKRNWLFLTLPMGILIHLLFGSFTPMTKNFLDINDHYILKAIIIISLFFGLKGITIVKTNK